MSRIDNKRLQNKKEQNSTLFNHNVDYEQPSNDRTYVYLVGKAKIYINEEQFKFLREEYQEDKTNRWKKSRCLVPAERGELKHCRDKCEECSMFRNGWKKSTYGRFEEMDEAKYLASNPQQSILDKLIEEERIQAMYDAIDNLEDSIDRYIMYQYLLGKKDVEVANKIGMSRQIVITRRNKCIEYLKSIKKILKALYIFFPNKSLIMKISNKQLALQERTKVMKISKKQIKRYYQKKKITINEIISTLFVISIISNAKIKI